MKKLIVLIAMVLCFSTIAFAEEGPTFVLDCDASTAGVQEQVQCVAGQQIKISYYLYYIDASDNFGGYHIGTSYDTAKLENPVFGERTNDFMESMGASALFGLQNSVPGYFEADAKISNCIPGDNCPRGNGFSGELVFTCKNNEQIKCKDNDDPPSPHVESFYDRPPTYRYFYDPNGGESQMSFTAPSQGGGETPSPEFSTIGIIITVVAVIAAFLLIKKK
ncbi:hypothetical protein KY311_01320 [Candidatus Woesearchaeota archaeon]|nr:hypothetical protein [Candidatus Woesearchaeota archaeon]MBW3016848.1 hypothetical protein [Candidatus Woesearchaeota archaeon]